MQFNSAGAQSPLLVSGLPSNISSRLQRKFEARPHRGRKTERWIDYDGTIR